MIVRKRGVIVRKRGKSEIESSKKAVKAATTYIKAAEDDFDEFDNIDDSDGIMDAIDDVADNVEDLQDAVDDIDDDEVEISINNNIADHFIAECDRCNGIFISAVVDSDQVIDHVSGTCPLCGKDTDQYLKWIIKSVGDETEEVLQ